MIKLPMSDFMQNYYLEKGITFTDSEKATILWNSVFPFPEVEISVVPVVSPEEFLKTISK